MKNGSKVFVVDDEVLIASTLATILRLDGYAAETFTSPLDALNAAKEHKPDLLLSDVVMPQMSGLDLAVKMQAICPECKILLISGQAVVVDFLEDPQYAGYDFEIVQKPIHPRQLLDAIRYRQATLMENKKH